MNNYRMNPLKNIEENKQRIIAQTHKRLQNQEQKVPMRKWKPVLVTIIAFFLCIVMVTPYLQQMNKNTEFSIDKIVIPNVPYDSLIDSLYIDESNELVYNTAEGFYSYHVESAVSTQLVEITEAGGVFDWAASSEWLIWSQTVNEKNVLTIFNRQTKEIKQMENPYFIGVDLAGDTAIFISTKTEKPAYVTLNLHTFEEKELHVLNGEGSNSKPAISDKTIVIPETFILNGEKGTILYMYDLVTYKQIAQYRLPYEFAQNVQLQKDTIYAYLYNKDEPAVIGVIDINTDDSKIINMPVEATGYATNGEYFALSVIQGESDTVQLYSLQNGELQIYSRLPSIKERLVLPRFTTEGTLILNGEGDDLAMYRIKFEQ